MKITFVLKHAGLSGGVRVVGIYAERLRRRGHEVLVVSTPLAPRGLVGRWKARTGGGPPPEPSQLDAYDVHHRVLERDRPVVDADVPDADVVVSTWWETAEWVARLSPEKGAKCSFLQHYEAFEPATRARVDATWRLPFHRIVISRWLEELAETRFGDARVSHVPNSVDTAQFHAAPRPRPCPGE